ncbi:MAG: hypothetical protein WCJ09_08185 [Planctomycetota bacterium]
MKTWSMILCAGLFSATTFAAEPKRSPRETFVAYFQAMATRQEDVADALMAKESSDTLHMNIDKLNIPDRLHPFYELTTCNRALVVANPFTILESVLDSDEVIYAELLKQDGEWRIRNLNRTSPENAAWLMSGFQIHPDVRLDLSTSALVGEWWYPCDSCVVLKEDGTGTELMVGPGGPDPKQKPERFTWKVKGTTLSLRFADREEQLVITSIDHTRVSFRAPNKSSRSGWTRKEDLPD